MKRVALILFAIALGACSSQPAEPKYYLLRSDADFSTRQLNPSTELALGKVIIAPYIDQSGLLMETTEGDYRSARQHMWAEPLYEGIRLFLLRDLSSQLGVDLLPSANYPASVTVNVRIDQLHGTVDGHARLVAYWWLERDGELVTAHQFAEKLPLSEDGYAGLVIAEKNLLSALATRIVESMESAGSVGE